MKEKGWLIGALILIIILVIIIVIIVVSKDSININIINPSVNESNDLVLANLSDESGKNGICGPCIDSCIEHAEEASCPLPNGSFSCKIINNTCTKVLLNNNSNPGKICTSNNECPAGYICIRHVEGMTNKYGGVFGTPENPGKCIIA